MGTKIRDMSLRERFEGRFLIKSKYAKACRADPKILHQVLDLKGDGTKRDGATRRVIVQLKNDGIWIGKLPWEK
ncbi:hypothetical protein [Sulfurimonas sp.]|uniref:hypothetical protein n=1 Tax=Sulfurimonas sp. TaxID=2022749 RepID=UPI0025DC2B74|nr:hypothetical protein [Sulfurimonas sp.]